MAIFHVATNTPPKSELIGNWIHTQPWGPPSDVAIELEGSFHLDDPEGEVGMQVFVVRAGDELYQVPLTYRKAPLFDDDSALVGEMEHSVLGTRYVHDGLRDDRFVSVLAGVTVHGYGQALGFAEHEGRWYSVPDELRVHCFGQLERRVAVDRFTDASTTADHVVLRNEYFELTIFRRLGDRLPPEIGLAVSSPTHPSPLTLVAARSI